MLLAGSCASLRGLRCLESIPRLLPWHKGCKTRTESSRLLQLQRPSANGRRTGAASFCRWEHTLICQCPGYPAAPIHPLLLPAHTELRRNGSILRPRAGPGRARTRRSPRGWRVPRLLLLSPWGHACPFACRGERTCRCHSGRFRAGGPDRSVRRGGDS